MSARDSSIRRTPVGTHLPARAAGPISNGPPSKGSRQRRRRARRRLPPPRPRRSLRARPGPDGSSPRLSPGAGPSPDQDRHTRRSGQPPQSDLGPRHDLGVPLTGARPHRSRAPLRRAAPAPRSVANTSAKKYGDARPRSAASNLTGWSWATIVTSRPSGRPDHAWPNFAHSEGRSTTHELGSRSAGPSPVPVPCRPTPWSRPQQ